MEKSRHVVLAVGAHPDDIEIGCGAALTKHLSSGDKVFALVLTNGENGKHNTKREECLASLKTLGVSDVFFGNFPDGFLPDNRDVVDFIEGLIKKLDITRVYTNHPNDRHQDHRNCSHAVSSAARKVGEIFLYQEPSTNWFEPHYFIEVSEENLAKKIGAVKCYKTQIAKGTINPDVLVDLARLNGFRVNAGYAEAFAVNHIVRDKDHV